MQSLSLISHAALGILLSSYGADAAPPQPAALAQRGINPAIPGYAYDGCVGLSHYTFGKPLQAGVSGASDAMTVEKCAAICWGYTYFGLEYGRECYCGWKIEIGHFVDPDNASCSIPCAGNAAQNCGAGDFTSMYKRTTGSPEYLPTPPVPGYVSEGCHTEATSRRALSSGAFYSGMMNVETCAIACEGFDYFGLEYFFECYCGNALNTGSVPALESECSAACVGQGGNTCGGSNRLSIHRYTTPPSPGPAATPPLNLIADGSFEGLPATYGSPTAWTIVTAAATTNYSWNFADTTLAHSGTNSLSLGYAANSQMGSYMSPSMIWSFNQSVTLIPNRRYKLTAWSRGAGLGFSTAVESAFCTASYSIKSGPNSYPLCTREGLDERVWYQSLGYLTNSAGLTNASFSVIMACAYRWDAPATGFKFHFDDIKLELVPEGKNFIG